MAIKLADTLAPMADFPAVEAKDVAFNDNKSLQEKYDNGELGGGGTSITVDSTMSDTSINPVQNKVIKAYVDSKSVDISADLDNAIQNKTDGIYVEKTKISTDDGNALSKKSNGLFVQDLSDKINQINFAQKTVNEGLDYCYCTLGDAISGQTYSINDTFPFTMSKSNNMTCNSSNHSIILKKGKTYRISSDIQCNLTSANISISIYNLTKGMNLTSFYKTVNNTSSESAGTAIYTPDLDDEEIIVKIISLTGKAHGTSKPTDYSYFIAEEIGRTITIDPLEYVNTKSGIEDTPVGEIIRTIGNETPKHYLLCDGSTHNIADYPYLAQYFKDTFGSINVFGGDGTTTFGVPDYITEKKLNTQYMAPNAWASSVYNSNYAASKAFNGKVNEKGNYWQTTESVTLPVEIGIDLGSEYFITRYTLHNYGWDTASINDRPNTWDFEGSNDKVNWNTIDTVTNYTWTNNTPEFKVAIPGSYRYYRLIIKTCVGTGVSGVVVAIILNQILLYYSNSNFTHIKAEPTYFMNLEGVEVIEDLLTDKSFDIKTNGVTTIDKSFTLPTPITDFDEIETVYSYEKAKVVVKDSVSGTVATATELTPISNYKGLNFPGTSTSGITYSTISGLTYPLTVEIAFSTTSNDNQIVFVHDVGLHLIIGITDNYIQLATGTHASKTNMAYNISSWNLNDGNFHTITVTYNSADSASLYFDGVLKPSTTYSSTWTMTNISSIGNRFNSRYDGAFKGTLYAVRFYNDILSQSDIVASYNSDKNYVLNNTAQITRNNLACEYKLYDSVETIHPYITSSRLSVRDIEYNSVLSIDKSVQNVTNNKAASTELQYTFIDKNNVKFLNVSNHYNSYLPGSKFGIRRLTGIKKISK